MSYFLSKWVQCAILALYKRIIELSFLSTMARGKQTVISSSSSSEEMEMSEEFEENEENISFSPTCEEATMKEHFS